MQYIEIERINWYFQNDRFRPDQNKRSDFRKCLMNSVSCSKTKANIQNLPYFHHFNENYDIVIAYDVLEHLPDFHKALEEVHGFLSFKRVGFFPVPPKDNLLTTQVDPKIIIPEDRTKHIGQWDHLRIFGNDFINTVEIKGFDVAAVNESMFSEGMIRIHVRFRQCFQNILQPPTIERFSFAKRTLKANALGQRE